MSSLKSEAASQNFLANEIQEEEPAGFLGITEASSQRGSGGDSIYSILFAWIMQTIRMMFVHSEK